MALAVGVSSCHKGARIGQNRLDALDSLAQCCPDSTLGLLDKYASAAADYPKSDRMRLNLIGLKARSYAFQTLTNDSIAAMLVDYYENDGDSRLLPYAYYYAGKTFYSLNDMPQAMALFMKAVETTAKDDHELLGRTYNQIGYVYDNQMFDDDAIRMYRKALDEYEKAKDTVSIVYALRDIGTIYRGKDSITTAIEILDKAKKLAESVGNDDMRSSISSQLADAYYLNGDIKRAWDFLKVSMAYADPNEANAVEGIAAKLYSKDNMPDSAFSCYRKMVRLNNPRSKRSGYRGLAHYYAERNTPVKSLCYMDSCIMYADTIMYNSAIEQTARMKAAYNYSQKEKENLKLREDAKLGRTKLACVLTSSFLVILLLISYIRHIKNKAAIMSMRHDLFLGLKNKKESERTYEEKIAMISRKASYKRVVAIAANPSRKMEQDDWDRLAMDINKVWPGFDDGLKKLCDMSTVQYRLCLLVMVKISPTDMATLLNRSKSTITSIRSRLYKKAFEEDKRPEDWDDVIRSI